jgi:hypothetical protein
LDLILKALAVLLLICGVPAFLLLGTVLGALASVGPPPGDRDMVAIKYFMMYSAWALAGLVSGAGGTLWAATRLAYPSRGKASFHPGSAPATAPQLDSRG